jgi:hypothetical protein
MRRLSAVLLRPAAPRPACRRPFAADAVADDDDGGRARRLAEMEGAASRPARSLPSADEVASALRAASGKRASGRQPAAPDAAAVPRDWRDALEAARGAGLGGDPLVDSFG